VRWSADVAVGDWIAARLSGWGVVGGTVPRGYACYVRIFHPGMLGRLPLESLAAVAPLLAAHTTAPADTTVGIWYGWADLRPGPAALMISATGPDAPALRAANEESFRAEIAASVDPQVAVAAENGPRLALPDREYVLLSADVREFADPGWAHTGGIGWHGSFAGPTPNILWPADRSWFLATEIDFDSTIIGGSRELIDGILSNSRLEAAEVTEETDLSWTGDRINPGYT
jgi:hypothetical protein